MPFLKESGSTFAAASPEALSLSELIKAHARNLGFSKVGIVRAEVLSEQERQLKEWLRRGYHSRGKSAYRRAGAGTEVRTLGDRHDRSLLHADVSDLLGIESDLQRTADTRAGPAG